MEQFFLQCTSYNDKHTSIFMYDDVLRCDVWLGCMCMRWIREFSYKNAGYIVETSCGTKWICHA